ncbi:MAG: hypothetical protein ACOCYG_04955 [Spirochaetota bacterium]
MTGTHSSRRFVRGAYPGRLAVVFPLVVAIAALSVATAHGQEFSEKREIAVFRLNYYGAPRDPVPSSETVVQLGKVFRFERIVQAETTEIFKQAVGAIDEKIRSVFIDLGRFDVIGMSMRLNHENVDAFMQALRDYRAEDLELPETVLFGEEAFTRADFNRLVGGFIVVVPSVSFYDLNREEDDEGRVAYDATIETSFTFIDSDTLSTEGQFFIETNGYDEDPEEAMREAVDAIPRQLSFEIRKMDLFRLRTGVLAVDGRTVTIEFGRNMGVRRGDEYAIVRTVESVAGRSFEEESGLLVVEEVRPDFSVAHLIYADDRPRIGDQLEEVPRFGIETTPYGGGIIDATGELSNFLVGVRAVASRGFFTTRPLVGLEIPIRQAGSGLFPLNLYAGGELNWYLGRLKLAPGIGGGVGGGRSSTGGTRHGSAWQPIPCRRRCDPTSTGIMEFSFPQG